MFDGKTSYGLPENIYKPSPYLGYSSNWADEFPMMASIDFQFDLKQSIEEIILYPSCNWYVKVDPRQEFPDRLTLKLRKDDGTWQTHFSRLFPFWLTIQLHKLR